MQRQQGVLVLTILILFMLSGWWALSHYSSPLQTGEVSPVVKKEAIQIEHSKKGKTQVYAGAMMVSDCDLFSAGVEAQSGDVTELTLLLSIRKGDDPCSGISTSTPFSVSVDAEQAPVVKSVLVGGSPASFEVVEKR